VSPNLNDNTSIEENKIAKKNTLNLFNDGYVDKDTFNQLCKEQNRTINHLLFSYGLKKGSFNIDDKNFINSICESKYAKYYFENYSIVEKKTEYYKLMFDFDFKEKNENCDNYKGKSNEIVLYIIEKINLVLNQIFYNPDIRFLYCDKNNGFGVHLYYPKIIVNSLIHTEITQRVTNLLYKSNQFNLTEKNWADIFDTCVSKANGLRWPYFCINNTFYKQNAQYSTYKVEEYNGKCNVNILKLCTIRTNYSSLQNKLKIQIFERKQITNDRQISEKVKQTTNSKIKIKEQITDIRKIDVNILDKLLQCINIKNFITFSGWFKLKFIIFNCNNSEEACQLFYKYSKVGKYKDNVYEDILKAFMNTDVHNVDPIILYHYARKDNHKLFESLDFKIEYDKQTFETIKFI
jgi:hypothetical protein